MDNLVFLETYEIYDEQQNVTKLKISLESLIAFCIYKYCLPNLVDLKFVLTTRKLDQEETVLTIPNEGFEILANKDVPWQVVSCVYPVVKFDDTIITGLCAVARHICKYKTSKSSVYEHNEGLLGFRKSCLQAPNEVSIWTKFCEVDIIKSVNTILVASSLNEIPKNLVRFENHLKKPVRVHNVYKIARDQKKKSFKTKDVNTKDITINEIINKEHESLPSRVPKTRKWKSNKTKELAVDCSTNIEDLDISHQFAEGPFLTLADLVLLPSYYLLIHSVSEATFQSLLPLTHKWYNNVTSVPEIDSLCSFLNNINLKLLAIENIVMPVTEDVSLYKSDPKRHNPKKRIFTKEDDIERALNSITEQMEFTLHTKDMESTFNWDDIPDGANPSAGHLPDVRVIRKSQQLKNLALAVLDIAKEGDLIVDFCSGSGHLGILIAYLLPKCTVILLENKEQSLLRARLRVHELGMKNVYFFQCNLDFFIGKFDIGIALHACGIASDLVLDKCLKANAKFVICPCCYGSLHATDRLIYPRSSRFGGVPIDQYLCIGHAADQTHQDHPLAIRGARCMAVIDSDRGRLAEEFGYKVTLSRLKPLSCTPKNNLLIGVP